MQSSNSIKNWRDLEDKVLNIFLSLGYEARKHAKIKGVRATHEVDVIASIEYGGLQYKVVVECKFWKTKVKKAQVATLLTVVSDIGAEKGVIISKVGFQKGAIELAKSSNIELYPFEQFVKKTEETIEKWFRHQCFDLLTMMKTPFQKFTKNFHEKAYQMDTIWYPTKLGREFTGGIAMFEGKLDHIENKEFPSFYMKIPLVNEKLESDWPDKIEVNNKIEYLKLMLDNIIKFKQSAEIYHEKIFSK